MYRAINNLDYDPQSFFEMADLGEKCWTWLGSKYQNGYGKLGRAGVMAHRIAYELTKGDVPPDMCLDHLCKNRLCVNPDHLEVVTLVENVMRGDSQHAVNARKTHCIRGHAFTKENTYIRKDRNTRSCKECARMTNAIYVSRERG